MSIFGIWRLPKRLPPPPEDPLPRLPTRRFTIHAMRCRPGDTVFLRVPARHLSADAAEALRLRMLDCVPEGVKVGILTDGMEVIHLSTETYDER